MAGRGHRYTNIQKSFICTEYLKLEERNISAGDRIQCVRVRYNQEFGEPVPCGDSIYRLVKKFELTGSVGNRNKGNSGLRRTIRTPEMVRQVEALVTADRNVPYDQIVNTSNRNNLNLSRGTWSRILKDDLNLRCFRL